ncbi:S49 family peptidase [Candidatus Dojkabacteria bacterium]|uniref:S49 family peptidase n=1 Tax=Candidatus Dojkabacteria bacterium TaxID=2099670 RepID=A0A3M0YZ23_9BACT|nr:MAG: S49 family peptidase [Candidatus Dojkabacteria bacterium]
MKGFMFGSFFGVLLVICLPLLCVLFCCFSLFLSLSLFSTSGSFNTADGGYVFKSGDPESKNKILQINIEGPILNEASEVDFFAAFLGPVTYGYQIKEILENAAKDESIKAVILKVNSPGGLVSGSKAIADGIQSYRERTGRKVYGFGSGIVASGAYWAISSSDKIFVDVGTTVGSIGVIAGELVYYDKLISVNGITTKNGIEVEYITAGEGKDFGSPFRRITQKEKQIIQQSANNVYDVFVEHISLTRGISVSDLRNKIGAYVYDEKQSKELKLIDEIASRDRVLEIILSELQLDNYQLVEFSYSFPFWSSFLSVMYGLFNSNLVFDKGGSCLLSRQNLVIWGDTSQVCRNIFNL